MSYKFSAAEGKVLKVVGTESHALMESIEDFELTSTDNEIFDVTLKTREEGKTYSFKVSSRSTAKASTDFPISTIDPVRSEFDKNELNIAKHKDITVKLDLNGNIFVGLQDGSGGLGSGSDYTYDEAADEIVISKEYLKKQSNGELEIVFDVSSGADPVLIVNITDTRSNIKVAGNAYEDEIARMNYPDNLDIDSYDSGWILKITSGTVKTRVSDADLTFEGLPEGLSASAEGLKGNRIKITLSGRAFAPVSSTVKIGIIIKGSVVEETAALDSDPVEVLLLPGGFYASPEHSLLFTNELVIVSNTDITGDIVIGRGKPITTINSNVDIYGYLYVDSSLTINSNFKVGASSKNAKLFVKGSVLNQSNTKIFGDLFYRDELTDNSKLTVTGVVQQRTVEIPEVSIPKARPEQWYINNGYTIISDSWTPVTLKDNGKYYFKDNYSFNSINKNVDNVTIVGMKDITINSNFSGSGILFTPSGKITVNSRFDFIGICVSQATVLASNTDLTFKPYTELPFN